MRIVGEPPPKSSSFVKFSPRYLWLSKIPPFDNGEKSVLYTDISQSSLKDVMELQVYCMIGQYMSPWQLMIVMVTCCIN